MNSWFSYLITAVRVVFFCPSSFVVKQFWFRSEFLKSSVSIYFYWQEKAKPSEFLTNFFRKNRWPRIAYCRQNLDSLKSYAKQTKLIWKSTRIIYSYIYEAIQKQNIQACFLYWGQFNIGQLLVVWIQAQLHSGKFDQNSF